LGRKGHPIDLTENQSSSTDAEISAVSDLDCAQSHLLAQMRKLHEPGKNQKPIVGDNEKKKSKSLELKIKV